MTDRNDEFHRRCATILAGVEHGPRTLLTLTEAEILALDGPGQKRITPLLTLGPPVSDQQRRLAADEAMQHLLASGRAEDGTPVGGSESDAAEPSVRTVLQMRRHWVCALLVDQRTALGREFLTVFVRADRRAMTEFVAQDGRHTFTVMKRAVALDAARDLLMPFAGPDRDGPERTYPVHSWQDDAHDVLASAKVASAVIGLRQDRTMTERRQERLTIYNLDDRTESFEPAPHDRVRLAPISRRALRTRLDAMTTPLEPGADRG